MHFLLEVQSFVSPVDIHAALAFDGLCSAETNVTFIVVIITYHLWGQLTPPHHIMKLPKVDPRRATMKTVLSPSGFSE